MLKQKRQHVQDQVEVDIMAKIPFHWINKTKPLVLTKVDRRDQRRGSCQKVVVET
jgi:hypothetical protein